MCIPNLSLNASLLSGAHTVTTVEATKTVADGCLEVSGKICKN